MSIKPIRIIAKTTVASEGDFVVSPSAGKKVSLIVSGLLVAEEIAVYYVGSDGTPTLTYDGEDTPAALVLSVTNPNVSFDFPCIIRVAKPLTANAVTVEAHGVGWPEVS